MDINRPFPGDWYAESDRPSAPSMRRILDCVRAGVCIDCGGNVEVRGFWWCGEGRCASGDPGDRHAP